MDRWFSRAALAAILGLGVMAGLARAQGVQIVSEPPTSSKVADAAPAEGTVEWPGTEVSGPACQRPKGGRLEAAHDHWIQHWGVRVVPDRGPRSPVVEEPGQGGRLHNLHEWWIDHRPGCWASHLDYGCGSCKSDCTFVFGSCRAFFAQPCYKRPPPTAAELYYGLPAGSYGGSTGGRGCGCP
jgi:hypothetical protein